MSSKEAIARVVCRILRDKIPHIQDALKLYFQGIDPESIVATVGRIQADPILREVVEIHLPRNVFAELPMPVEFLTDHAVGDFRNEEPEAGKKIMLLGCPNESEWDTVRLMQPFGEQEIMDADDAWVEEFAPTIIDEIHKTWWKAALRGLNSLAFAKLNEFASFVSRTSQEVQKHGILSEALGASLPALRLPCRTDLFAIGDKQRGQMSQWKRKFNDHRRATQCFLTKRDKSETLIDNDVLAGAVKDYRDQPDHDPKVARVFDEYVAADYGWTTASAKIAEVDWSVVNAALFERVKATKKQNLAEETIALFENEATLRDLVDEEKEYLEQLAASGAKGDPSDEDKTFFRRYYRELQHRLSLFSRWESFILEKSVEDTDFLNGLARCMKILRPRAGRKPWKLVVRAKASKDKDLILINEAAGTYFATRYQGLPAILNQSIEFKGMRILEYPELLAKWKLDKQVKKKLRPKNAGRDACQLVFYVELASDPQRQIKLVWRFKPKSVAAKLRDDIERLTDAKHPAIFSQVVRETSGRRPVPIDLEDAACLQPVFGRASGSLIPQTEKLKSHSVRARVVEVLAELCQTRNLSADQAGSALASYDAFEAAYKTALVAFLEKGLSAHAEIGGAAEAYGSMLQLGCSQELSDTVMGRLLPVLLSVSKIEVASFGAQTRSTAIIPPWHPLRLLAIASKAAQFAESAKELTSGRRNLSDADGDLFFEDMTEWLSHVYYPEIVCQLRGIQPEILADCENFQDYSVHELPVKSGETDLPTDTDVKAAAGEIGAIVESYLELQPHERDNLSVVLFDCGSELLPKAVVETIRDISENEDQDAMCQILLTHSDIGKLRALYRSLTRTSESSDAFNTSEATREFMARLRINIMVAEDGNSRPQDGAPYDIVFTEGTIARQAHLDWEPLQIDCRPAESVKPSAWSRRKPMRSGAISAAVYLASPTAPEPVWAYLNAIAHAKEPERARLLPADNCLVPARSLGVHEETIGHLIDKMHSLGSWVVNYDELLHRKLLENKGIKIIRYKQDATQGRNLIISSKAKDGLLRSALRKLTSKILPDLDATTLNKVVDDLITEANAISGNIVLRAVRRAENAKELLGLVLSKYLVTIELGPNRHNGWFFLDDYASWLGEKEKQIADILCLSPGFDESGFPILDIVVTEAKFVEHAAVAKKAKESASQLRQTLARLESGLGADDESLDRDIWLARISDMIVDGIEASAIDNFNTAEWRRMVRDGGCGIRIRGYSHVFDHGTEHPNAVNEPAPVKDTQNGYQEVFCLNRTREFLKSFVEQVTPNRKTPGASALRKYRKTKSATESTPFADGSILPASDATQPVATVRDSEGSGGLPGSSALTKPLKPQDPVVDLPDPVGKLLQTYAEPQAADTVTLKWMSETTVAARKALVGYDMPAELAGDPILTPNSLLLKFKGSDKLTAAGLEKKRSELYTTHGLKVVNIYPHAGAIAVSIERPERQIVRLGTTWKHWQPCPVAQGNTRLLVAVAEEDNSPVFFDPMVDAPHSLIAGTSGSGKSVLLQNILLGIAATNTPDCAHIYLIDPKSGIDFGPLSQLPHIKDGLITSREVALETIEHLVDEMEARYPLLAKAGVNHLRLYNAKQEKKLPYIWLIHDEFADWMSTEDYKTGVVAHVSRLGMKARAAGIFLVFATQRPSVEVMPMQLRDNLDNRLILRVASEGASVICLGEAGADNLLKKGQMLARLGSSDLKLCQVPFAELEEIEALCQAIRQRKC